MPAKPKAEAAPTNDTRYPNLEKFVEQHDRDATGRAFATIKKNLQGLPAAKAAQGKKALAAVERAEDLLSHLFDVKEKLSEGNRKPAKGKR